jgi:hypothetical protein
LKGLGVVVEPQVAEPARQERGLIAPSSVAGTVALLAGFQTPPAASPAAMRPPDVQPCKLAPLPPP